MTSNGTKTCEVRSEYMAHFASRDAYDLSDSVIIDFYDELGNHSSTLTSDFSTVSQPNNIMVAFENVVVVSDSGVTLITEELNWDNEQHIVYTDKFVTFVTETDTLFGQGFESDRSLKNYKIHNPTGISHRNVGDK